MKNKNISFIYLIIIFILITVIIMLYKTNKTDVFVPGNNVNIFEIKCNCEKDEDNNNSDNVNKENKNDNEELIIDEDAGKFVVKSNGLTWGNSTNVDIFANPLYNMKEIIAPGSSNIYKFLVKNSTDYNLLYNISFKSVNQNNINILYRLKNETEYIIGNETKWVTAEELILNDVRINKLNSDTYYLEWKWFESDNDTEIGMNGKVKYSLNIIIVAEEYYE